MSVGTYGTAKIKQETAYGVEAVPDVAQEIYEESIKGDNNLITPDLICGRRVQRRVLPGAYECGGGMNFPLFPESFTGHVLKGLLGAVATTNLGGGAYRHVFTVANELPSFTVEIDRLAACFRYKGAKIGSLALSLEKNKLVDAVMEIIAQNERVVSPTAPTYSDLDPFAGVNLSFTLNGVPSAEIETCNLSVTNELERVHTMDGTRYIRRAVEKTCKATGSLTQEFGDKTMLEAYYGQVGATTPQAAIQSGALSINIDQGIEIASSGFNYGATIAFSRVFWTTHEKEIKANNRILQNIGFVAVQDLSTDEMVTITLVNGESGYPNP